MSETNHLIDLINNGEALVDETNREIDAITSFVAQRQIFTPETARPDDACVTFLQVTCLRREV
eukprot:scaffold16990_cov79-Cyclotella_meneghiniana.AAC.2